MLAGALTRNNATLVGASIGRKPTNGELYIAHFLGADGAGKLINGAATRPQASAAAMFPHAAAANHNIFYGNHGRPRSVGEVYGKLTSLFDSAQTVAFARGGVTQPAVARSGGAPPLPPPVTIAALPVKAVPARAACGLRGAADSTGANPDARYGRDDAGASARQRAIASTSGAAAVLQINVHRLGEVSPWRRLWPPCGGRRRVVVRKTGTPCRCSTRSATCGPTSANSATRSEGDRQAPYA